MGRFKVRRPPEQKVRVRLSGRGTSRLAGRSELWRRWAWQKRHGPRRSGTPAGTPRSGLGTQTKRCVQTRSVHSYCVSAGCRGRHTLKTRHRSIVREQWKRKAVNSSVARLTSHWQGPARLFWCGNLYWRGTWRLAEHWSLQFPQLLGEGDLVLVKRWSF